MSIHQSSSGRMAGCQLNDGLLRLYIREVRLIVNTSSKLGIESDSVFKVQQCHLAYIQPHSTFAVCVAVPIFNCLSRM